MADITPAQRLIDAARDAFYRCDMLPPDLFNAVRDYEAANQECRCACHNSFDDHCDECCVDAMCEDCRAYSEPA